MNIRYKVQYVIVSVLLILTLSGARSSVTTADSHYPAGERAVLADDPSDPSEPVKLIFIHHSCGENWLNDSDGGLGIALRDANYFVSDTNYGWTVGGTDIGSLTDIGHWWEWFRGANSAAYMSALYTEYGQNSEYSRLSSDPGGENEIVMFKSCYPNSNLGGNPGDAPTTGDNPLRGQDAYSEYHNVANAKGIYNDLLEYFATTDKLFVVITAPPVQDDTWADNARAFNTWLVEDWLDDYPHNNVAVFDFYNVLTSNGGSYDVNDYGLETGNHHRVVTTTTPITIEYITNQGQNTAAYPTGGSDNHPSAAGNQKATGEFVPLLNVFYNRWQGGAPPAPTLTLDAPDGGEDWTVSSQQEIAWSSTGSIANVSLAYSTDGFATAPVTITASTANDGSYDWTIPDDPSDTVQVRVASVVSPTIRDDSDANFAIVSASEVETYTFNAIITPSDATEPITYTWSPEPDMGQGTESASYRWSPGAHEVTLSAINCGGELFTDTRAFTVGSTARNQVAASLTPLRLHKNLVSQQTSAALRSESATQATMTFTSTADVILASDANDNANLGGLHRLETFLGGGGEDRRSLMSWDLSALPGDITINQAAVELYRYDGYAEETMELALYRVTREWTEGTGNDFWPGGSYVPDGATWLTATTGVAWTEAGGDYNATAVGTTTLPSSLDDAWIRIDATDAVQDWTGGEDNYGLLLRPVSGEGFHYYHSGEAVTSTLRPRLVVTYTSGAPAPTLELTAPTGSTRWPVSSTRQIQWTTSGTITEVNLSYSLGDGFTPIESNVTNSGSYDWTTPPTATTSARVRVQSSISATISDTSAAFELYESGEVTTSTVYLPLVVSNYAPPQPCPNPLTGVEISDPITETTPSGELIQPGDLSYLGAFRLPDREAGAPDQESWEYSGGALTHYPAGDSGGEGDGHPGSLFGTGHNVHNYVSEVSIPAPTDSSNVAELNYAETIQGFADVRDGLFGALTEMPRVGMQYLPAQTGQSSAKLHLSWGAHHQDEGSPTHTPSHAWCDLTLSEPNTQGAWWMGEATVERLYRANDYIFEIPSSWADARLGGARLATGRYRDGGWSGMGPNIFAYGPWLDGSPPVSGTVLTAHELLAYSYSGGDHTLDYYHDSDDWTGGAWLTAGSRSAVVFVGTKGGGDYWWYGYASPAGDGVPCVWFADEPWEGDPACFKSSDGSSCVDDFPEGSCTGYEEMTKGWWSSRADAQIIFYDPADLAAVESGTMEPYEPQPYARLDIDDHLLLDWPVGTETDCGSGDQRKCRTGAIAYDRERGFLYVLELFADEAKPVVHVWGVE